MRQSRGIFRLGCETGFTLIEVTLALAVALIGMLAVLSLLPQGLQSGRSAADNTISATIVQNLFSQLRSDDFANIVVCLNTNCTATTAMNLTGSGSPVFYFDQSGAILNTLVPTVSTYYKVTLSYQSQIPKTLASIQAIVVWPEQAELSGRIPANTSLFATEVAQYGNQ